MKKASAIIAIQAAVLIGIWSQVSMAETTPVTETAPAAETAAESAKPANYVVLKAGMYSPSDKFDLDNYNGGHTTRFDSKTGFNGEIAVGRYLLPVLAVELGAGYFESKGSAEAEVGETKLKVIPVIATAKAFLPLGMFEPYGLFGIGAYITELDVEENTGTFEGSTKVTYGLHAGAGFNINFTDAVFMGLEGKYVWAKPSFGGQDVNLNGFVTTANLGLRF